MTPSFIKPPKLEILADMIHDRIEQQIDDATKKLTEGQSLLVEFILKDGRIILPSYIGYHNPTFIVVYGQDSNGNETKALIPHTMVEIVVTILNKPNERKPIGFQGRDTPPEI